MALYLWACFVIFEILKPRKIIFQVVLYPFFGLDRLTMKNEYSSHPWLEEFSLVYFYLFFGHGGAKFMKKDTPGVFFGLFLDFLNMKTHWSILPWDRKIIHWRTHMELNHSFFRFVKNMMRDSPKVSYTDHLLFSSSSLKKNRYSLIMLGDWREVD